jgi:hypothetical protein
MSLLNRILSSAKARFWSSAAALLALAVGVCLPFVEMELASRARSIRGATLRTGRSAESATTSMPDDASLHSMDEAIERARVSRDALKPIDDYTALFSKIELVEQRVIDQRMEMKFRRQPFSVYLRCCSKHEAGREVIFVEGENKGKLLVHEGGIKAIAGTSYLELDDPQVMDENRYPIIQIGIEKMLETVLAVWEAEKGIDTAHLAVQFGSGNVGPDECDVIEVVHQRRVAGLKFHKTRLFIETRTKLPVQVEQYDWPAAPDGDAPLVEGYTYSDIQPNVGLTDADFDRHNKKYKF